MAPRIDRWLAAVMAVDVVGYSRLVGADEAGTLGRVKAHRIETATVRPGCRSARARRSWQNTPT